MGKGDIVLDYFVIPLQVFGWGFVISLLIAFLIKGIHMLIGHLSKESKKDAIE